MRTSDSPDEQGASPPSSSPPPPAPSSAPRTPPAAAASFDDVFCALLHRLYRRAAMLGGGSRQSAEDAVHEVYLKLAARPERFLAHPEPYAYAFSTLLSVVRDGWRRERRHLPVADVELSDADAEARAPRWDGGVEQRASELEVVRLLGQLSVRQAGVVILVDLDGYTIDQAASILGLHRGTVSRTRRRALDRLRVSLGPAGRRRDRGREDVDGAGSPARGGAEASGEERRHAS